MKSDRFYLACLRDTVGTNVSFHSIDGYSSDVSLAKTFTREEAQQEWNSARDIDLPLCADRVDQFLVNHVDCQLIPYESQIVEGCTEYVGFQKGRWNGNDVFWLSDGHRPTDNFDLATIYSEPTQAENIVWLPYSLAVQKKRPTFHIDHINRRTMIQAAGLLTPDHVKRRQRRKASKGLTRYNCPGCGRVAWQSDPHVFEGCKDPTCDAFKGYSYV